VRLAGTAIICVVAAFGAAFLVARAVNHQTPARAATPPATQASVVIPRATGSNAELRSQFTPMMTGLKPRPRPHRHRAVHHSAPAPAAPTAPTQSTPQTTTQQYTTPQPTSPQYAPAPVAPTQPSTSGSGTTHHHQSGGGSGTTTIGG
jgi:hypothetical protein